MVRPLRARRLEHLLSVRELAARSRISHTAIWEIERGATRQLRLATIRKLAAALEVAPADVAEFRAALGLPAADSDAA